MGTTRPKKPLTQGPKVSREPAFRVLVVDDEPLTLMAHRETLAPEFDVLTASSGQEALELCDNCPIDLVILDAEMPDMTGYETCRRLRAHAAIPIVFVTAHASLEAQLSAYEAGGTDLLSKPVLPEILLHKIAFLIEQHKATLKLAKEKVQLEKMAFSFLSSANQSGTLLEFVRTSIASDSYELIGTNLLHATKNLGLTCSVILRHDEGNTVLCSEGEPTPLIHSILEQSALIGRQFQFKSRLVVNYDQVSVLASDMPDEANEPERAGTLRDNLTTLAETAAALIQNVASRREAYRRTTQTRLAISHAESALRTLGEKHQQLLMDSRLLLQELVDNVEKSYAWLGTTQEQESTINGLIDNAIQRVIGRLSDDRDFDADFEQVLSALHESD